MVKNMLIDKGELWNVVAVSCHYDDQKPLEAYAKLIGAISEAPVVDAIPVVWIREQYKEIVKRYREYEHPSDWDAMKVYESLLEQWDTRHDY
jgi:hypothetical protein